MIQITLPFPPSCNTLFPTAGKKRIKSRKYESWIGEASLMIREQRPAKAEERCVIHYSLNHSDNRTRDAGNYEKALTDLLVLHGIIPDDGREHLKGVFSFWNDDSGNLVNVKIYTQDEYEAKFDLIEGAQNAL